MWYRCLYPTCLLISVIAFMNNEGAGISKPASRPVNDPLYKQQASYLKAINVPAAWRRLTSTRVKRKKVTVALIDTGVKPDHPDLVGNLVTGYNVIRHNTNTSDPNGHGTHMAGVFGATINNSVGIAGVMDLVNIMPISVEETYSGAAQVAALDYAIRNKGGRNIKIILMAISGPTLRPEMGMLCVTGTEQSKMKLGHFSDFADYVDIAAPGVEIMAPTVKVPYAVSNGTSPSAAIVAGVAAMLYSLAPDLTPADVKKILKDTSTKGLKDYSGKTTLAFGRVDADKAVAKLIPR